jgi:hypothetical protein
MIMAIGISFNLIIIRVDQGVAVGDTYADTADPPTVPLHFRSPESAQQDGTVGTGIEVLVTRVVDQEHKLLDLGKDTVSTMSAGGGSKARWDAV